MAECEYPLGIALTILAGVAAALQAGSNATLGKHSTRPFAAAVSFTLGTLACCIYLLVDATAITKQLPSAAGIKGAPWWSWIGGLLGAYLVVVNIIFALRLGSGTAASLFVCAQLVTSIIVDLTGLVGFPRRAFAWQRILGAALMIAGVLLVTQFPGQPVATTDSKEQQQLQPTDPSEAALSAHKQPSPAYSDGKPSPPSLIPAARDAAAAASGSSSSSSSSSSLRQLLGGWGSSSMSSQGERSAFEMLPTWRQQLQQLGNTMMGDRQQAIELHRRHPYLTDAVVDVSDGSEVSDR